MVQGHAPFLEDQDGLVAVGGQRGLDDLLVRRVRVLGQTSSRRGGSHASTRPMPSDPLAKKRARNSPPRRRSPSTSPYQRARRRGSVSADHRSSIVGVEAVLHAHDALAIR